MRDEFELDLREPLGDEEEEETSVPGVFSDDEEVIDPDLDEELDEDEEEGTAAWGEEEGEELDM